MTVAEKYLSAESLSSRLLQISDELHSIDHEEELVALISRLRTIDSETDAHLDDLIDTQARAAETTNMNLDLAKTELLTSLSSSSSLMHILSDSSYLAKKLTYKVKFLDYERLRVSRTKEYVQHIISLRKHIVLVNESIEKKDWDTVSKSISVILHDIPGEILHESKFADIMIPTSEIPERPETLLKSWVNGLKKHYVKEFNNAVRTKDIVKLTNFFSYFPMIGEKQTGLSCYADFINNIIAEQSRSLLVGAPKDKINFYSAALMKLFEIVSKIINQHSKVIVKHYDNDSMAAVINKIQREVDSQAGLITDTFWDARNFDRVMHDLNSYTFPFLNDLQSSISTASNYYSRSSSTMGGDPNSGTNLNNLKSNPNEANNVYEDSIEQLVSVVEIGNYVNEISTLLNRWSLYCGFIAIKWKEYSETEEKVDKRQQQQQHTLQLVPPLLESSFLTKIEVKLVPCLENLSAYYMKKTLEKSFKMEELPDLTVLIKPFLYLKNAGPGDDKKIMTMTELEDLKPLENPPISSVVEDLIIILNTVLTNILETGQPVLLKNLINNTKKTLHSYFFKILLVKLRDFQPRQGTNLLNINSSNSHLHNINAGSANDSNSPNKSVITGNLSSLRGEDKTSSAPPGVLSNMLLRGANVLNSRGLNDEIKLANYIIYFNSISMFRNYFNKLVVKLTNYNNSNVNSAPSLLEKNFQFGKDLEKLKDLVDSNLVSSVNKAADTIIKDYSLIFFNQIFKSKVKSILNDFFSYNNSYLINSSTSTDNSTTEIKKFIRSWLTLTKSYYRILAPDIFAALNSLIVTLVVEIIEKKIWLLNKKINLLGVIKLEKDISMIINEVTKNNYTLREHFIRITQIIMIMGFDDEADEADMDWILTNNERRKARYLRIDRS